MSKVKGKGQGFSVRAMARGPRLPKTCLAIAHHDHEGLHDLWCPTQVVVPLVVGEAVASQSCPK